MFSISNLILRRSIRPLCVGIQLYKRMESVITLNALNQKTIKEGKAEILVPEGKNVFYNPVQEFNRDLSVAVLKLLTARSFRPYGKEAGMVREPENNVNGKTNKKVKILEALSATGLRSIRYAKEVESPTEIVANDLSNVAVEIIKENLHYNGVEDLVKTSHNDANAVMFENRSPERRFDVVDLDPYGCPSIFLDAAVQCVADGGVLMVTCTDMGVLCGNVPNTCYVKYGSISLKNKACHEMALRIVLQNIESHATRYKRYIVPLLSISADFYVRVFVQIFTSAVICKMTTSKLSHVYQCVGCDSMTLQPLGVVEEIAGEAGQQKRTRYILPSAPAVGQACFHCGSRHRMGGPIWTAPLHNHEFVDDLLQIVSKSDFGTSKRLEGVLSVVREELIDVPLYYSVDRMCATVHSTSISMMAFRSAILNAGYRVSLSHAFKNSIKTDAPMSVVWDVIRAWVKKYPVAEKKLQNDSVARAILNTDSKTDVNFSLNRNANPLSREKKLVRYQENPTPFWGPGCRSLINDEKPAKKERNQSKKRKRREMEAHEEEIGQNVVTDKNSVL